MFLQCIGARKTAMSPVGLTYTPCSFSDWHWCINDVPITSLPAALLMHIILHRFAKFYTLSIAL